MTCVELNKYISIEGLASGGHVGIVVIGVICCAYDHRAPIEGRPSRDTQRCVFISALLNTSFPLYKNITM